MQKVLASFLCLTVFGVITVAPMPVDAAVERGVPPLLWLAQADSGPEDTPEAEDDAGSGAQGTGSSRSDAEEEPEANGGEDDESASDTPGEAARPETDKTETEVADDAPPATGDSDILRSPDQMPEPVRQTWQALIDVARSGNIERLRLLIDAQPSPPVFSFGEIEDPIDYLKSLSGDAAGREMLAILLEILETGYIHVDRGSSEEMYLWPYFARYPLAQLTPRETVEMFTILTAGDYQDMVSYGAYIFFRVGIGPDGTWHFFVAGD